MTARRTSAGLPPRTTKTTITTKGPGGLMLHELSHALHSKFVKDQDMQLRIEIRYHTIKPFLARSSPHHSYPTINNLRLAYRINEKTGLRRDEINAAFVNTAHLLAFTLGLYPSLNASSIIRIIPIHPCAKILVNLPDGQSVHNLGFDTTNNIMELSHVPSRSIALFLVLILAGKVADMSATCRPDSQKSALLADSAKSCRHNFVPDTFFVSGFADFLQIFSKYQRYIRSNHRTNWYV